MFDSSSFRCSYTGLLSLYKRISYLIDIYQAHTMPYPTRGSSVDPSVISDNSRLFKIESFHTKETVC